MSNWGKLPEGATQCTECAERPLGVGIKLDASRIQALSATPSVGRLEVTDVDQISHGNIPAGNGGKGRSA